MEGEGGLRRNNLNCVWKGGREGRGGEWALQEEHERICVFGLAVAAEAAMMMLGGCSPGRTKSSHLSAVISLAARFLN